MKYLIEFDYISKKLLLFNLIKIDYNKNYLFYEKNIIGKIIF